MTIQKYEECPGGHHIHVTAEVDGKAVLEVFDKDEVFTEPMTTRELILGELRQSVTKTHPSATSKDDVSWHLVKSDMESK